MIGGFAAAAIAWAQTLRPGMYEISVEMTIPEAPAPIRSTTTQCLTPEQVRDVPELIQEAMTIEGCTFTDVATRGNAMAWHSECDGVSSDTEMTFTGEGFTANVVSVTEGERFTTVMSGKWIGAICTAESLEE